MSPEIEEGVCYTYEAALEKAIEMEEEGFRNYLYAIKIVDDRQAKMILKEAAVEELHHKQSIEKALLEGYEHDEDMSKPVPTINLNYVFEQKELEPNANARQSLAYAIHLEKAAVDFYKRMLQGCEGAPMAPLFKRLLADETKHLKSLEDFYEDYFLAEN